MYSEKKKNKNKYFFVKKKPVAVADATKTAFIIILNPRILKTNIQFITNIYSIHSHKYIGDDDEMMMTMMMLVMRKQKLLISK